MDLTLMSAGVSTHPATFAAAVKLPGIVRINPRVKLVLSRRRSALHTDPAH